ncbi:rRNA pseudouridine synthase [Mycoplasmopsis citelli]|uniref:Pseudouridine synthase n=1 Tax=Mycoplasmopsis citelli TaxID=171281 RepID=A0A449B1F4_9BACT|nr:pseudouridine synthase [Mycoplasmopsis citelli]UUD35907.1 rRNA pseudouridine synthase [Mycoplasmopsis citelli]VEU74439.1 Pseudouridine synthase [Mycoplasmopsis citelli]
MDRIEKIISQNTNYSRSEIKKLILQRKVLINTKIALLGQKINSEDQIFINNQKLQINKNIYIMLNKPAGYLSANVDKKDKVILDLINDEIPKKDLNIWGRLDKDTEGLIILSNDGELGHKLLSPKNHIPKTYYVEVNSSLKSINVNIFKDGIEISNNVFVKGTISNIKENSCLLTIYEGKFHQIKLMFSAIKMQVTYLKRVSFGPLNLDKNLQLGQYRFLSNEEINKLQKISNKLK